MAAPKERWYPTTSKSISQCRGCRRAGASLWILAVRAIRYPQFAGEHAVDAARVGSKVADLSEPLDRTSHKKNDDGERLADARHAGEQAVLRSRLHPFLQALFKKLDLGL